MLRQAVRLNSLTELALTKLDVLDAFDEVKVCTGYRLDGRRADQLPGPHATCWPGRAGLRELPGWGPACATVREPADLPAAARAFCRAGRARRSACPSAIVGVGAERDDYVLWQS